MRVVLAHSPLVDRSGPGSIPQIPRFELAVITPTPHYTGMLQVEGRDPRLKVVCVKRLVDGQTCGSGSEVGEGAG
jgi:hypothetical protein